MKPMIMSKTNPSIEAGCEILYSEDMQHNLLIEQKLRIVNPFR